MRRTAQYTVLRRVDSSWMCLIKDCNEMATVFHGHTAWSNCGVEDIKYYSKSAWVVGKEYSCKEEFQEWFKAEYFEHLI